MGSLPRERGVFRVTTVADPAVADSFEILSPAGVLLRIIGFRFTFVTDANAAFRSVFYEIIDLTRIMTRVMHSTTQAANTTRYYTVWSGFSGIPDQSQDEYMFPFPVNYFQERNFNIHVNVVNMQAGDQLSDIFYLAEEWIEDF